MMKRTGLVRFETYDKAWEKASELKKTAPGKEGVDWKVRIIRRGSPYVCDLEYFEVVSYISSPDKSKKADGDETKKAEVANN